MSAFLNAAVGFFRHGSIRVRGALLTFSNDSELIQLLLLGNSGEPSFEECATNGN